MIIRTAPLFQSFRIAPKTSIPEAVPASPSRFLLRRQMCEIPSMLCMPGFRPLCGDYHKKRAFARKRTNAHYHSFIPPVTYQHMPSRNAGPTAITYSKIFQPAAQEGYSVVLTGSGLTPAPDRWDVHKQLTVSVIAFSIDGVIISQIFCLSSHSWRFFLRFSRKASFFRRISVASISLETLMVFTAYTFPSSVRFMRILPSMYPCTGQIATQ